MSKTLDTLILVFHPGLAHSRANAALAAAAAILSGVEVVDVAALYPDGVVDHGAEAARLLSAKRIVLQFPVQWYSLPISLRTWQDAVLTRMYYMLYEAEGRRLEGTPLLVSATAGNTPEAYAPGGQNHFPLAELLRPLEAMAHRCGLPWAEPHLTYRANRLDDAELGAAAQAYAARLAAWIDETAGARAAA